MKKPRGRYHHRSLREAAVEAAAIEIDEHGHQGFTLEKVTRRLGVTPAALYRHFANRDALLLAVIGRGFARFAAQLDGAVRAQSMARDVVIASGEAYAAWALENIGCFRLQFSRAGVALFPADQFGIQLAYPELMRAALRELLGPGADLDRAFVMVWSFAHGLAGLLVEQLLTHLRTDPERIAFARQLIVEFVDRLAGKDR